MFRQEVKNKVNEIFRDGWMGLWLRYEYVERERILEFREDDFPGKSR